MLSRTLQLLVAFVSLAVLLGRLKMQDVKLMTMEIARGENAGH